MILIGDIGNTDTKICLINLKYKIIKRIVIPTKKINKLTLLKSMNFIKKKGIHIKKSLFCSVVPKKFVLMRSYIEKNFICRCIELKKLNINLHFNC